MLVKDLIRNSLAGSQTDLVLLDISKAFDKVSHQKLLLKLHKYGIRGPILKWIEAFLSERTQTVFSGKREIGHSASYIWGTPGFCAWPHLISYLYK